MKPPRRWMYGRGGGKGKPAGLLLLGVFLCLSVVLLLLLHGSSPSLEGEGRKPEAVEAAGGGGEEEEVAVARAEVEEAPLPPGNARLAFLFIARNRLPLDLVWDAFFRVSAHLARISPFLSLLLGWLPISANAGLI